MDKENILLIQLFSNGDCLFATTIACQIKHDFPNCSLTWAISSKCKNVLINNPFVDEILEIDIPNSIQNEDIFEALIHESFIKKNNGIYKEVIVSQLLGDNLAYYDSTVCTSIFRCFKHPITVDTKPIINLTNQEIESAKDFALMHQLNKYKNIVLFECAPQSNQIKLTNELIYEYCLNIIKQDSTCVILSAPNAYNFNNFQIIDGNTLSIRETIALSQFCTHFLGCSSGISWALTSNTAKELPMVQLLSTHSYYFNPLSLTFNKLNRSIDHLIELTKYDSKVIGEIFHSIFNNGFFNTRIKYNQKVSPQFKLYRGIIHKFIVERKFNLIKKFISINIKENGFNINMIIYILLGFILFPIDYMLTKKSK
jgi:hypothetical protein